MPTRKRAKAHQNLYKQSWTLFSALLKGLIKWLGRSLVISRRSRRGRSRLSKSGFVLPMVTMVLLVVVLLTTAMMLRSFDRSRNASNVRVNQAVLNAATPALARARAKVDELFNDPALRGATPSDTALYNALTSTRYNFGDETRLKLVYDINQSGTIEANTAAIEDNETLTTAWKFPVDTDGNGKFDSYTLYGIYFRSPSRGADGKFNRARNPLEARTPPMAQGNLGGICATAFDTSANSVGGFNWYKSGSELTKSFFVYTASVPISEIGSLNPTQYEQYKGNRSFYALEYQQDQARIPLNNNAVWYEDDIEVSNAPNLRINGRVFTNSNLMVAGNNSSNSKTIFYQVSDPDSCYYQEENSKIVVGGNVANGDVQLTTDQGRVEVHRFQGKGTSPAGRDNTDDGISSRNKTTQQTGGRWVGYNNKAYSDRINLMVQAALSLHVPGERGETTIRSVSDVARYPQEVKERFIQRLNEPDETKEPQKILIEELETYFKDRTRRVPYAEVPSFTGSVTALRNYTVATVLGYTNPIRPPDEWMAIEEPTIATTNNYTNLDLKFGSPLDTDSGTMYLQTTEPTQQGGKENFIGDRIVVGNNLPFSWPKYTTTGLLNKFFDKFAAPGEKQLVKNGTNAVYWTNPDNSKATNIQRTRQSQLQIMPDLGSVERDGFWETQAAKQPAANENTGGLRVVTGAGIYIDGVATNSGGTGVRDTDTSKPAESFLPDPALNPGVTDPAKFSTVTTSNNDNIIVWPDLMPMWMPMPDGSSKKGDLQMRATAVYHYKQGSARNTGPSQVDLNQVPIACVSSYYDSTNETTARNLSNLPDVSGISTPVGRTNSRSNNGVTYFAPYTDDTGRILAVNTYRDKLNRQARAIFPTGRVVNEPLRKALIRLDARDNEKPRSLADNAALDTAICALKILDGTLSVQTSPNVPHGAIKEAAFLDARQVKSLNNLGTDNTKVAETPADLTESYTLPLEQRQPLEIRVTELDLNLLKNQEIGTVSNNINNNPANNQEYLLPNSGIIYATRDDALRDLSDSNDITSQALGSSVDFKLDSNRRPNGIRLINGSSLARKNFYRVAEKGLILATNLPTYIKGDFNLHKDPYSGSFREEFTDKLDETDWNDFYDRNNAPDQNFACRQNQPGCADNGDQWRAATIISDAQTLLSNNFLDGFRNQGDYDLNNNQGNSAANSRKRQGFWNNNFVTTANWADANGYPSYNNSYLSNGVTPIQRRVNFPEYVMEICRKLPVSECGPQDWVIGYDDNGDGTLSEKELNKRANELQQPKTSANGQNVGIPAGALVSGTTARFAGDLTQANGTRAAIPPARLEDRRYARRVAFARKADGTLELQPNNNNSARQNGNNSARQNGNNSATQNDNNTTYTVKAFGIDNNGNFNSFPYSDTKLPRLVDNALWFRTTNNTNGNPGEPADITYANNKPLYYLPPELGGEKLFLPDTPDIGGLSLNLPTGNQSASDYAVCVRNGGISQSYTTTTSDLAKSPSNGNCPTATYDAIINFSTGLDNLNSPLPSVDSLKFNRDQQQITSLTLTAGQRVNVYELPRNTLANGATITLKPGDYPDAIFVLKSNSGLNIGINSSAAAVQLNLNGINPNNVFWAVNGPVQFNTSINSSNGAGNFIGSGSFIFGNSASIQGRILGFTDIQSTSKNPSTITALTSDGQPSLVPVLQIHSPTGTPGGNPFNGSLENNWLQVATTTTANAAFVTGDSPSRPNPSENGGGLFNLVRFLENWSRQTARISGSFMQHRRSSYASAPFNPVAPTVTDASASLFYTLNGSNQPPYSSNGSDTGFRYRGGESGGRASFFMQPTRASGFDVALMSQSPDLFGQRFTVNTTSRPSEYSREVGRNDSWIQTLLCAAQGSGNSYTYAIDSSDRPTTCPSLTAYSDQ